jgi:hypothetical protein
MNSALGYLTYRFFYRLGDFFHHWYADASRQFFHRWISLLERLDRTFALRITLKFFFQPLYKDYTFVGRILGVIFRSGRIIVSVLVYAVITAVFLSFHLLWFCVPPLIILYAARHL